MATVKTVYRQENGSLSFRRSQFVYGEFEHCEFDEQWSWIWTQSTWAMNLPKDDERLYNLTLALPAGG